MLSTTMVKNCPSELPPGFRFHPTDEELIVYYLRNQAASKPCHVSFIPEVDIYKFDPWQLPEKSEVRENEWYFFSPRDRKYPNGVRPNRATASGYWKATGTDKAIHSGPKLMGVKKALVFYTGRPPKGVKTDWIMHEYRLNEPRGRTVKHDGSMRLDDWVLCRIYKKKHAAKAFEMGVDVSTDEKMAMKPSCGLSEEQQPMKIPRNCSLLQFEYGQLSQLLGDDGTESQLLEGGFRNDYLVDYYPFYHTEDDHVGYALQ